MQLDKATAKYSRADTKGKLYVDCSECERGGNGSDKDKCSCGWQVKRGKQGGCFLGTLRAGLTVSSPNATGEQPETRSDDRTQIVVRLRRSYWHDNDGAYQRTSLRYIKRHTKGFNFFDEDCSMVGTEDVIPKIVNLAKCEDGVYLLVMCNAHRDWETGHVEDWDYQLLPFSPNATGERPETRSEDE